MDNPVIEIRDEAIDVEEIMQKIRENIRRRKEAGLLPEDPDQVSSSLRSVPSDYSNSECDFSYLINNYDIQNNSYFISSHQPYIGKYLIKGRNLVHGEVRRYIDPVIWKQTEFNRYNVDIIRKFDTRLNDLEALFNEDVIRKYDTRLNDLETCLNEHDADLEKRLWLTQALEKRVSRSVTHESESDVISTSTNTGINYFVFEDRFRGTRALIKDRQNAFLKYFEGCRNVLDIGCGRGEFLELMKEQGIGARGVDLDETMVDYCRMRGLEVDRNDALSYLEELEDGSLDGIFIDQVVEHLEPGYLIRLIQLCHQKMQYGFYLVAETVNPLSFFSLANFYIDMTHVRPVHPETLKFLFDNAGFRDLEVNFSSSVTDNSRLQKMPSGEEMSVKERNQVDVYNRNVEMLNGILYGAQDYSVVGKK